MAFSLVPRHHDCILRHDSIEMADNGRGDGSRRETSSTGNKYPWGNNSFDYVNWYYWSIWWQQYWLCQAAQLYGSPGTAFANGFSGYPSSAVAPDTASVSTGQFPNTQQQQQQWAQYVQRMGRTAVHVPPTQNANTAERQRRPEMLLRINLLRGWHSR